jgi:hypothetical protein
MQKIKELTKRIETLEDIRKATKSYFSNYRHKRELEWFESWIEAQIALAAEGLDKCPKCDNNLNTVPGGRPCEHCGAIGQQPWGG